MQVAVFASQPQYVNHLLPIWRALPKEDRLRLYTTDMALDLVSHYLQPSEFTLFLPLPQFPAVVASFMDYQRVGGGRKIALIEHGVGQVYGDNHPSNPGGLDREGVTLYICPNQQVADLNQAAYPEAVCEVVGSPWLDTLQRAVSSSKKRKYPPEKRATTRPKATPTIAFSFRWDNRQQPETESAFPAYAAEVAEVAKLYKVLGHGHPRGMGRMVEAYESMGVEVVHRFEEVVSRADLLCVDNSSAGPEWAAVTGRPMVWMNAPNYRHEIDLRGRFWTWTEEIPTVDDPVDLCRVIADALTDTPEAEMARQRMVDECFAYTDGKAAQRAAAAILKHLT